MAVSTSTPAHARAMEPSTSSTGSSTMSGHASPYPKAPPQRKIGRWYLGETLGKGGYSWVKKGRDRKTNRCVALKFMERKKKQTSSGAKQLHQVKTEIEALKHMKHPHIVRLLAYNLSTKYPDAATDKDYDDPAIDVLNGVVYRRDVILLVLEYMPGGELFDILYYTAKLDEIVARTYLKQLISGLEACHKNSIIHRDIKPQNLLLGRGFNLKITDFGLAKLQECDEDLIMETYNVGTRGYQAPEVLLRQPYTGACDIFSVGVVLFILLAGYPPFEHARATDRWYGAIANRDYKKFWRSHKGCGIKVPAQDLISRMLRFDSRKRIGIAEMKGHPWFMAESLDAKQLHKVLRIRHMKMELKRARDPIKQGMMATSARKKAGNRPLVEAIALFLKTHNLKADARAKEINDSEDWIGLLDVFTTKNYIEVLNAIVLIVEDCKGSAELNLADCSMSFQVRFLTSDAMNPSRSRTVPIAADVRIFWSDEYQANIVKFYRKRGPHKSYREFIKFLVKDSIFTGLPESSQVSVEREVKEIEGMEDMAKYIGDISVAT